MTAVYWLVVPAASLPDSDEWLSPDERRVLAGLRFEKRRADWRLGRLAAKRALAAAPGLLGPVCDPAELSIAAARDGAPEAWRGGRPAPCALSISHSGGRALCVVSGPGVALGCDLERVEPREAAFVADFFTTSERARIAAAPAAERDLLVTLLWSAKESALKALREGLRRDTRDVEVDPTGDEPGAGWSGGGGCAWRPLAARLAADGRTLHGFGGSAGGHVATLVADPRPDPPVALAAGAQREAPWAS